MLSGATWIALRAYQRGLRTSSACPFCNASPEDEEHILWHCIAWDHVRGPLLALVHTALSHLPELPPPGQWPPCLRRCGLAPELSTAAITSGAALTFIRSVHSMYVCIMTTRKQRDAHSPSIFAGYRMSQQVRQYPYHQLVGPLPQTVAHSALTLRTPKGHEWKWEKSFLADLLSWLRALTWPEEQGTVTFLELAIDFEEFAQRTLPHAPQAKYTGNTLSLQERGRVLRLAMASAQRLVTSGQLHPAGMVTRCGSLVPLGGPAICGLNKRPYFARREAMLSHIRKLVQYCEEQWVAKAGTHRTHALRPYTYRPRKTAAEIEAH